MLPDDIEICKKAAGYRKLSHLLMLIYFFLIDCQWICNRHITKGFHFVLRVNLDSVQSEASALLKRLNETSKKVSNSVDEVKEQYTKVLEVGC